MSKLARMHTSEHILSAVMKHHYNAPRNLELHLGEKKTKCDYQVPSPLQEADIEHIERLVNSQVRRNHPVSAFFITRNQADDYDLWKVPEDAEEIRIVKIGDFDAQPCSGEHVSNTEEIGTFRISSYEMKDDGRVRIRFKVD